MSLAVLSSRALFGMSVSSVQVEVHVGAGLPSFSIVGLPGAGVRESRERVRAAIISSGFEFPAGRIIANLAPADLPKDSGRFDLAIAIGVLLASGQLLDKQGAVPDVKPYVLVGELSLTGAMVSADSALVIALNLAENKTQPILIMALQAAGIAALVPGLHVLQANSLLEVVNFLCGKQELSQAAPLAIHKTAIEHLCMADVRGQLLARRALELAAAGGHSMLMSGSPGVGKSMLAQRLPGLLPELSTQYALESAAITSLHNDMLYLPIQAPIRAPHHSASMAALVGGGAVPRPGEISLAHRGVLFLDELPEFDRRALEALREPLETGHITIARASGSCQFPAKFQLIAAMNPCPCGWFNHPKQECTCSPTKIMNYRGKISGPLLDRIDLYVNLSVESSWADMAAGESSQQIRHRVIAARNLQFDRQQCLNSELNPAGLALHAKLGSAEQIFLSKMVSKWSWSARSTHRCLRLARTIADLDNVTNINIDHLSQAAQYRSQGFNC